jgi:hypothetical protein
VALCGGGRGPSSFDVPETSHGGLPFPPAEVLEVVHTHLQGDRVRQAKSDLLFRGMSFVAK